MERRWAELAYLACWLAMIVRPIIIVFSNRNKLRTHRAPKKQLLPSSSLNCASRRRCHLCQPHSPHIPVHLKYRILNNSDSEDRLEGYLSNLQIHYTSSKFSVIQNLLCFPPIIFATNVMHHVDFCILSSLN